MPDPWLMIGAVGLGAMAAGFVQGASGFAFSLVAMALWAWTLPPQIGRASCRERVSECV